VRVALLAIVAAALSIASANAAVVASVDADSIDEMESVTLTVRVTGAGGADPIDTAPLERDFEVLTTATNSQFRSVNGRVQSWVEYQFVLRPRRTGMLEVPPLAFGAELSEPIRINVRPMDEDVRRAIRELVFFETTQTPGAVWVQAEAVLTRRLYYSAGVQIYSDLPGAPQLDDAVVIELGAANTFTTNRDGRTYGVVEQRFAIFPERSGMLTIPSIAVTSSIRLQTGGRMRRSGVRVASEALQLDVLPIPAEYPADQPWLPAADVRLLETWTPRDPVFMVGEPVHRVLTVNALGGTASAIPPLVAGVPDSHFRQYPEPEQKADDSSGATVLGARIQAWSIMPTAPGEAILPEVRLTWWNTVEGRVETALVRERRVAVSGVVAPPPDPGAIAPAGEPVPEVPRVSLWWFALAVGVGFTVFAALLVLRWTRRPAPPPAPHASRDPSEAAGSEVPASTRPLLSPGDAFAALNAACRQTDPAAIRATLVALLATVWGIAPADVATRLAEESSADGDVLARLNASLYGRDPSLAVERDEIIALARRHLDVAAKRRRADRQGALPQLYEDG
jgi:hypothetical protein